MSQKVSSSEQTDGASASKRQGSTKRVRQPPGTEEYVVSANDTFSSIAVKFGVTTSELKRLNKLFSLLLFPGQVLYVPARGDQPLMSDEAAAKIVDKQTEKPVAVVSKSEGKVLSPLIAKPVIKNDVEELEEAKEALCDDPEDDGDKDKISVPTRLITKNEGIVGGHLVVTPEVFSFRPLKTELLVAENGWQQYTVDLLVRDVSSLGVYEKFNSCSLMDKPVSIEGSLLPFLFCQHEELSHMAAVTQQRTLAVDVASYACRLNSDSDVSLAEEALFEETRSREGSFQDRRLPGGEQQMSSRNGPELVDEIPVPAGPEPVDELPVLAGPESVEELPVPAGPESVDELPIPSSPFGSGFGQLGYLCLRAEPMPTYEQNDKHVHTFIIPHKFIEPLFRYLEEKCSSLQNIQLKEVMSIVSSYRLISSSPGKAFNLVEDYFCITDEDLVNPTPQKHKESDSASASPTDGQQTASPQREHVQPIAKRVSVSSLSYTEMPVLIGGKSNFLLPEHLLELSRNLPRRVVGCQWSLVYSTSVHGFSLRSLYRRVNNRDGPYLLVVEDSNSHVFGVLSASTLHISDQFEGTGESFVFTFHDGIKCDLYGWTGENSFFVKGDTQSIAFGSGEGHFGLWLDGDLYYGSSRPCKTFDNEVLSSTVDFTCKEVEVWGFL